MRSPTAIRPLPSRTRQRRRRIRAAAASAVFHVIAIALIFGGASGATVSGGGAGGSEGTVMTVSLVRPETVGLNIPDSGGAPLFLKSRAATDKDRPIFTPPPTEDQRLQALLDGVRRKAEATPSPAGAPQTAGPRGAAPPNPDSLAELDRALRGPAAVAASSGDLWGQIEPCWRSLPVRARTPVTLEIALDATGSLRTPPKVIRPAGSPIEEGRLRAEAAALNALAACLPRNDRRFSGGVYQLNFGVRQ